MTTPDGIRSVHHMGHSFGEQAKCHCGVSWEEHQESPRPHVGPMGLHNKCGSNPLKRRNGEILAMRDRGYTSVEISRCFNLNPATIRGIIRRFGAEDAARTETVVS